MSHGKRLPLMLSGAFHHRVSIGNGNRRDSLKVKRLTEDDVTHYFLWDEYNELRPTVVAKINDTHSRGFHLPEGRNNWWVADPEFILDWFYKGELLTRKEFEGTFGKIGVDLPELPSSVND
jgi:hypothetical protein